LAGGLKDAATNTYTTSMLDLVAKWLPLQTYVENHSGLHAEPGKLAKICIKGLLCGPQGADADADADADAGTSQESSGSGFEDVPEETFANALIYEHMREPLIAPDQDLR
jgi:hypothetical protein